MKRIIHIKVILLVLVAISCFRLNAQNDLHGIWARKINYAGSNSGVVVSQVLNDSKGNTFVSGRFYGTVSLSGDMCSLINSGGYPYSQSDYSGYTDSDGIYHDGILEKSDGFINKYDNRGNWLWSVIVKTDVWDQINNMVLFNSEKTLAFLTSFGNANYSGLSAGTPVLIDGTGATHGFNIYAPAPLATVPYNNFVTINTATGEKIFDAEANYGVGYEYIRGFEISQKSRQLYMTTTRASQYFSSHTSYLEFTTWNEMDGVMNSSNYLLGDGTGKNSAVTGTKNDPLNSYHIISYDERDNYGQDPPSKWYAKIIKRQSYTIQPFSDISYYNETNYTIYRQNYAKYGIVDPKIEVNEDDTHLFVTGHTLDNFLLQSTSQTIVNSGGGDGIIVCYDASSAAIRWMVNLRAAGNQNITDLKFDEASQTLRVIGYIDNNNVDFNPLGTAMVYKAANGTALFYAVYDKNGICQHVELIDSNGDEKAAAFDIFNEKISLAGSFNTIFQADPDDKLNPLLSNNTSGFLAKYSTNPFSVAEIGRSGSYSAADNVKGSYGSAFHESSACLSLGTSNNPINNSTALTYVPGNSFTGTANVNYNGLISVQPNIPAGGLTINVSAKSSKSTNAYLTAWIDFNGNGVFDPHEQSDVVTVLPNTTQTYQLKWTTYPNVTKAQLETYLRIRLLSDQPAGNWAVGDVADGEVEDYALNLNLMDVSKTAVSNNASPNTADIDDVITYTITATNKVTGSFVVFDPIPAGTSYVSSSPAGSVSNVTLNGQTVSAIVWNLSNVAANTTSVFEVKVKVDAINSNTLYNIGYVVMHGDTIATTANNCYMGEIALNTGAVINAQDDYIRIFACDEKIVSVLDNDVFPVGATVSLVSTPSYGSASISGGDKIKYQSNGASLSNCCLAGGLRDSIKYKLCENPCDSAYVIIDILHCPQIILEDPCSVNPKLVLVYQYQNMVYEWEHSTDGTTWSTMLAGNSLYEINIDQGGYYRLKITYDGQEYKAKEGIKITLDSKVTLPGDLIWYNMSQQQVSITW